MGMNFLFNDFSTITRFKGSILYADLFYILLSPVLLTMFCSVVHLFVLQMYVSVPAIR